MNTICDNVVSALAHAPWESRIACTNANRALKFDNQRLICKQLKKKLGIEEGHMVQNTISPNQGVVSY